ncbi:hypothetical protein P0W64_01855 [Tsukamurella sp. 8F]|uniref:hypothetical protein n=1 Tax=unclassified Tsukamurella TaxID=2633480 RepID=UPI0023B8A1A1|nr:MULTISPECIES: hypothetical protein [unclassified Tsukamurella]MDF0528555.1 hypothetical protein [Tsukamurella sp. 8J]MDF0585517.1 hypothetical protein [Tsukamurella sp. 8F]
MDFTLDSDAMRERQGRLDGVAVLAEGAATAAHSRLDSTAMGTLFGALTEAVNGGLGAIDGAVSRQVADLIEYSGGLERTLALLSAADGAGADGLTRAAAGSGAP